MSKEQVATPDSARTLWVAGDQVKFMGDQSDDRIGVVDVSVMPGSGTPPHRHASPEVFLVTEGVMTFGIFGDGPPREIEADAGTVVTIPSGLGHNYRNDGHDAARFTAVVQTEMLRFFDDVGSTEMPPPGPPSDAAIQALMAACARHGIEILQA
jgi:quercetin dioxygenase-like cupin family protein